MGRTCLLEAAAPWCLERYHIQFIDGGYFIYSSLQPCKEWLRPQGSSAPGVGDSLLETPLMTLLAFRRQSSSCGWKDAVLNPAASCAFSVLSCTAQPSTLQKRGLDPFPHAAGELQKA
ncbi:unnamed protein product [Rangifer tarandus platyrhynchus]|uniref:Uncharacterized protein n=2 Tax=Rangifer tarandus platyrhynchus TaxID=3082113 RepID=A0AC60A8Y3_RANTA|nr:unnamed protein product [Rangifer tarandus platyrhynchus]